MPKYTVTTTARATIRETWTVEATTKEAAEEAFDACPKTFVGQEIAEVDGDIEPESDREVESVMLADVQ